VTLNLEVVAFPVFLFIPSGRVSGEQMEKPFVFCVNQDVDSDWENAPWVIVSFHSCACVC
jgi:hypothetical protein